MEGKSCQSVDFYRQAFRVFLEADRYNIAAAPAV